jgi:metal-responsive CopG/Arc/MetJ family transcriptional regulator
MKTIRITITLGLLQRIDKECGGRRRSAFFRQAAQAWLKQLRIHKMEEKHKQGYARYPVKAGEFDLSSKKIQKKSVGDSL